MFTALMIVGSFIAFVTAGGVATSAGVGPWASSPKPKAEATTVASAPVCAGGYDPATGSNFGQCPEQSESVVVAVEK